MTVAYHSATLITSDPILMSTYLTRSIPLFLIAPYSWFRISYMWVNCIHIVCILVNNNVSFERNILAFLNNSTQLIAFVPCNFFFAFVSDDCYTVSGVLVMGCHKYCHHVAQPERHAPLGSPRSEIAIFSCGVYFEGYLWELCKERVLGKLWFFVVCFLFCLSRSCNTLKRTFQELHHGHPCCSVSLFS